jgi:predicted amino acid-binding ACT domain protein
MIRRAVVVTDDAPATTTSLVVTVMGPDRPGIVSLLSDKAQRHGANWAASRLSRLAGEFAGMVHFEVPRESADAFAASLQGLEGAGLKLVVAKSDAAHEGLSRQFAAHDLERAYLAVCNGHPRPASGTIAGKIGRADANRKKMAVLPKDSSRGKRAVTHYKVLRELDGCSLVECRLETGRTHQVRVHLSSIGHALLGDPLYGRPNPQVREVLKRLNFHRQALHAGILGFIHPITGDQLRFTSDLPPDMEELIDETGHSDR